MSRACNLAPATHECSSVNLCGTSSRAVSHHPLLQNLDACRAYFGRSDRTFCSLPSVGLRRVASRSVGPLSRTISLLVPSTTTLTRSFREAPLFIRQTDSRGRTDTSCTVHEGYVETLRSEEQMLPGQIGRMSIIFQGALVTCRLYD